MGVIAMLHIGTGTQKWPYKTGWFTLYIQVKVWVWNMIEGKGKREVGNGDRCHFKIAN